MNALHRRGAYLAGRLSENFTEHETPEDLEQEEFMDEDEEDFREPFNSVIYLSQAEKDRAEIRANGVHGHEHEHDPPTPSSTSTQEPPSPHLTHHAASPRHFHSS
jgi:hypothetical protein